MRLLVVGGTGYLGREVVRQASTAGHEVLATHASTAPTGFEQVDWLRLDIRVRTDVTATIRRIAPAAVIHTAYRKSDWDVTANGAAHVAVGAAQVDARLVHVSSDAVFSGAEPFYDERALPDPVTSYGAAKAAAETAVCALHPRSVVARTSLIVGDGDSMHEAMVHALVDGSVHGVLYTDVIRCPIHVADLAAALLELAVSDDTGVMHVAGADAVSRYELGELVARRDRLDVAKLPAGRLADLDPAAPLDVRLHCEATQRRLDTRLRGAREFLGTELDLAGSPDGRPRQGT